MNSTRLILIGIGIALFLAIGIAATILLGGSDEPDPGPTSFPMGSDTPIKQGENVTVYGEGGESFSVRNFAHDGSTKEDPLNDGYYLIGQGDSVVRDFSFDITYIAQTSFFNVSLMQEPLGAARAKAEAYLAATLGLSNEDLCKLRYSVATPSFVSETYAGQDLRFSFCSDATPLP
jgi:hypothetical protein